MAKRIISLLLAACMMISVLPVYSIAADTAAPSNHMKPGGYHLYKDLPTEENPEITGLYLGAAVENGGSFYGLSSAASSNAFSTTTDIAEQGTITVRYGGNDPTYGAYYYVVFTLSTGASYALAYASGYFSNNKIQDTGEPSGGWQAKHKMFYDQDSHFFYHRPAADMTVMKGLKLSTSSKKIFTETVANLQTESTAYVPVRLYASCVSDGVSGSDATHGWSGCCSCGYKFDYQEKAAPEHYHVFKELPTAETPVTDATLYLGAPVGAEETFYGLSSTVSSNAFSTNVDYKDQCAITVHYGGNDSTYGAYYYVVFTLSTGASYALAYASGYFSNNKIQDSGEPSGGWQAKHKMFYDQDSQFFYHRPAADMTVMKGLKLSTSSKKIFTETVANLQTENAAYVPVRLYTPCVSNGVSGSNATHKWSGSCSCGYRFDLTEKTPIASVDGLHLVTELPNAENPITTEKLYLGAVLENDETKAFYGLSSLATENAFATTTDIAEQCNITVLCGGNDAVYGDYYYVVFTLPSGASYALTYAGGYFTNNKIQDNDEPSGGWQAKHKMFYDQDSQFFYHRPAADMTVMKGLKLSTSSQKIFTETVANLQTESTAYVPVRLFAACAAAEPAGSDETHHWDGICSCGYRFGYEEHDEVTQWNYQVPEGHGKVCSCGYVLVETLGHTLPDQWETDPQYGIKYAVCVECGYKVYEDHDHIHLWDKNADGHWQVCGACGETTQAQDHTYGPWTTVTTPTTLADKGSEQQVCTVCEYAQTRETFLSAEEFVESADLPVVNAPFYLGATQLQIENTPTYFFKGVWAPSKYQNMDVTTDMYGAKAMYAEKAEGGYKLYFDNEGVKTYLILDNMVVSEAEKVFVQPVTDADKASVFQWNSQYATFQADITGKGAYYIGLYTDVNSDNETIAYTKLQALPVRDLGRDDRHPAKVYMMTGAADHEHSFGAWDVLSTPTHLQEQGKEERTCSVCGGAEIRMITLSAEDFAVSSNPPAANVPFYLGATQLQVKDTPTYFFKGAWAPSKYQNMDVTTDMYGAKAMYAEEAEGGYKLYFDNEGVKTYLILDNMVVSETEKVFVQPVTDVKKASVFQWNNQYATFQTNVPGKGEYYIGLYTDVNSDNETVAYTKLQALLVSGLGRDDRHPAKVYMMTGAADHEHSFGEWDVLSTPTHLQEQGKEKRTCSICGSVEIRVITLSAEDFTVSSNPPAANVPFYLGATQLQVKDTPTYFFKGAWAPSKYQNMDVTTDMYGAKAMYAEETEGGYKLYFDNEGVKTYLILDNMVVSETEKVFVQPVTDADKASVFQWNNQYATFQTNVPGKGAYYIGLYTDVNSNNETVAYTKLQALLVSGLGREDRHPAKVYMMSGAADHEHSFGEWVVMSIPTHLQEQGKEERTCSICGGVEIRVITLSAEDFTVSSNPPAANVPFYLGATQLQIENTPTYFFKGAWAPSKYQNMDVTTDMYGAKAMYAEEAEGGYKLYFDNEGVKTYLILDNMVVSETEKVFVQPVTNAKKASVFQWNNRYATFQTNVPGKGEYYIGLYTEVNSNNETVAYTKLQALLVSGLGRNDRHPAKIYMATRAADHEHSFGDWDVLSTPNHLHDQGREERVCTVCGYMQIRVTTLCSEDFVKSIDPPATNVPFYLGATQLQIENKPTYFFKGAWAPNKYQNMDVTTDVYGAKEMYAEAVNGGYKLYFDNEGVKTYLIIAEMTVGGTESVFVQPVTDVNRASVFLWHQEYGTFYTNVPGRGDYYIGLYTSETVAYTKLQALLVSGLGRSDRHPGRIYLRTYEQPGHEHTFGQWQSKSYATHLNDQGVQERVCTGCGYVQARVVMLSTSSYVPATSVPYPGTGFYLGAKQLQLEDTPTYFFMGQWLPRKFQRMDVTDNMKKAALMHTQAADGGYKLYFIDEGVKTYLTIAEMVVERDRGVFVQPVTGANEASVFTWNEEYCTFQTSVEGKGDYCIGNYTVNDLKYTKLSALPVSQLGSEDFHPAVPYVLNHVRYSQPGTGDTTPVMGLYVLMVLSAAALVVLVQSKKKFI